MNNSSSTPSTRPITSRLWGWLTEAHPGITDPSDRSSARLAASFLFIIVLLILLGGFARIPQAGLMNAFGGAIGFSFLPTFFAYILTRTKWYRAAVFMFSLTFSSLAYVSMASQGNDADVSALVLIYVPISLVVASAFLSSWAVFLLTGLNVGAFFLTLWLGATYTPDNFGAQSGIVTTIGLVLIALTNFRNANEKLRIEELRQINEDLLVTKENLEARVAERTQALATSAEVSRRLSTILDRKELVKEVVEQLKSSFNYYHAHIYLLNENTKELVMAGGTGEAGETLLQRGHKLTYGKGLVGRAAESKQPVIVPDTSVDPAWLPNPLLPETRAEIAVPIKIGEQLLGVLDVQNNTVNSLTEQDAELIGSIAAQFGIALLNIQSTEEVKKTQEQYALALEGSNDGIWDWDVETNQVYYSPRWKAMVGYGEDELNNGFADFEALLHPEDKDRVLSAVGEYLNGNLKEYNLQFRFKHKGGTYRWIQAKGKALRRENGAPYRMAGSHTDITESVLQQEIIATRAREQEAVNLITQRIQSTTSIENALQVAARELGHALGMKQTLLKLESPKKTDETKSVL